MDMFALFHNLRHVLCDILLQKFLFTSWKPYFLSKIALFHKLLLQSVSQIRVVWWISFVHIRRNGPKSLKNKFLWAR